MECPADCALNDGGTGFKDHLLTEEEYVVIPQLVSPRFGVLFCVHRTNYFCWMQAGLFKCVVPAIHSREPTQTPTLSLGKLVVGRKIGTKV